MHPRRPSRRSALLAAALLPLAACAEHPAVVRPGTPPVRTLAALDCAADVRAGSLLCRPSAPDAGGARGDLLLGGQGVYVRLAGSATYDGSSLFSADVTLQNLLGQPIGTTDGVTEDPDGIRVFLHSGPSVTGGTGTVEVANEDGTGSFTGANQPYFRYDTLLSTEETSLPREWQFTVPNTVETFVFTVYVSAPVPDEGALAAIDFDPRTLAVGGYHSCALTTTGAAYCWGANDDGQMGSAASDSVPVAVSGGHTWASLTAGRYHTCGVTTGGAAYCWGDNQTGQLGDGGDDDSPTPLPVSGGHAWRQLDAGAGHTCGVTTAGAAYCWGDGTSGQLGAGDSASTDVPVAVDGGRVWASVDAGTDHSCGVSRGGAAFCWGDNGAGELGDGTGAPSPSPVLVDGDHSWKAVSAGEGFSCGVVSTGEALCWGSDSAGQIGNGADPGPLSPDTVAGGHAWSRVTAGRETACGVTTAGSGYCWGFN
ncbi:MAG TPA: hypothetical protein VFX98_16170, partial [Longimicrobiaceae bacterium]|nr:hypothetical protein [Longimicrobiaceae bacterium]